MTNGHIREIVSFAPSKADHIPAIRIAASVAVPLAVLLLLGRVDLSIYASFGAFTSIYARQEPLRDRLRHQSQAAALLIASIGVGLALAYLQPGPWAVILVCALVGGVGAMIGLILTLRPPGGLFFIFASGAVGSMPTTPPVLLALLAGVGAAAWSILAGMAGSFLGEGRRGPVAPVPAHHDQTRKQIFQRGLMFFGAAAIAGVVGQLSGLSHAYWAMVAAVAPIAAPNVTARLYKCIQRIVGTFGGILIAAFLFSTGLHEWHMAVYVVILQFLAEAYVMRNYGFAMFFVTPLALMMVQLAHPASPTEILTARMAETAIGAAVGFVLILLTRTPAEREADTQAMPILRHSDRKKKVS
ncbi:FUSC family protein [Rothia sp. HC945]|uniref:FUSC family protein n=1 Tax=Rothia sp. HC945 TaxID=3171170 RepID=UPI0026524605|nr:FUSC family protein [Kocuria sp.]MDN5617015.1 FUSC family protein [Kocuria sp.]MDN5654452.1 FUSC family protein [Kocuria sp.]